MTGSERKHADPQVLIRFVDGEFISGCVRELDLDRPDLVVEDCQPAGNTATAVIALRAVRSIVLHRQPTDGTIDISTMRKIAIHYADGEVSKGLLCGEPERHREALSLKLICPASEETETLVIPYSSLKGIFFIRTWDSRPPRYSREQGRWMLQKDGGETPLFDLLGEIRDLHALRQRGAITRDEYSQRRRAVLDRI